ncbi:LacI family transcriptional regulator [Microbacterium sp. KSW4-16]|uniref:LacI family DNA-binding transcriptional regulator n=1 Tax=Microbacterium TaxID=33882 RepID=UPI00103948AE|nr:MULTISPECIES: LacI family DNA-binding transcriptional regulator [Microbacterium]MCK8468015.1 LacI family transcriptional regulator [Microbacterium aurugineum]QEA27669.1 LacI family transcriptional regulator [Microbacterium sp. CBA3102]TCJ22016.1 LacI family transcriptional regulator [Microbacterium sp. PI-1]
MATIYDVAELAGVSPATVSRVFNGTNVSEEKVAAVRNAAEKLKFTPNRTARTLRRQSSEVIALVIPDIENPYFTEMARGVEDVASEAGYSVVLCNSDAQVEKEATYLRIAIAENMSGVIIATADERSDLDGVLATGRPVVAVDRSTSYDIDSVMMANRSAGTSATRSLIDAGHRRIAYIGGPAHIDTAAERAAGWRSVLASAHPGHALDELERFTTFRVDGGRSAMEELLALREPPDAVVAGNNLIGVGAIQVLTEHGLTPPDVGVAVIGSLPFTTLSPTAVTVVRLPARHMGVTAARMLLDRIDGDTQPARTVVLRNEVQPASATRR